ncbi:phage tail tape measure protein [Anaerocolumna sp. AGMB13025]|uniref:phage tail tape measure protein n=1 Tax=Anaerocolumna sp. AGMB13025 TaxID=3039116 RepID=UPI00241F2937|nr:phage tail tape measure protein [Anaerocolumna sp. AGMB13025]WFR55353.1 phage tail tape measure protein [Anaerocolumna sp. AGMB13025]
MAKRTEYELQIAIGGKVDNSLSKSVSEINRKLDSVGSTMKAVAGIAATAFTSIKIKDFFDETTEASKEMQSSMAGVAKVVDGLKDANGKVTKSYYEMKDSILDMSENLPKTAEDIAAIMEAAGQSNIAKNELAEFAEDATKMGVAFDATAEQAGDWMAAWRTALKLDQSGVVTLADQINYLGNTTSENALKISDVVTRVGALANTAGISAASVAALSASMTKVAPEVAATGIKNFSLALVSGESATKKQAETFKELGLEAGKVSKAMQTDSQGTILDVLERINKLDKDKQTAIMKNLFGSESLASIAPLVANLDNLKEQFKKVGDSALYAGSMEQEYISASSTAANVDVLRDNKIKAMQIKIGDTLLPLSTMASETTGNLAKMFGNFVEESAPEINKAVEGITDTFQEYLPDAVYGLKSFAKGSKEFLSGLKPVIHLLEDNPDLIPNFLKSTGTYLVTYKLGKNIGEIVKNLDHAGSPLKLLKGIITNPWALAIGATAGSIAFLATSISSAKNELKEANLDQRFGDITLSLEDIDTAASDIIKSNNLGKLSESLEMSDTLDSLKDTIDDSMKELKKFNWKVNIGLALSEEEQGLYKRDITDFISDTQNLLLEDRYKLDINMDLFLDGSKAGDGIRTKMDAFYNTNYKTVQSLGEDLQKAVNEAFSDGLLSIDESKVISDYMQQMAEIKEQMADAKLDAKMTALETDYGTNLTPESFQNLQTELNEQVEETKKGYIEALSDTLQSFSAAFNQGDLTKDEYDNAVSMAKEKYRDQVGELVGKSFNFQYSTITKAYSDIFGSALPDLDSLIEENKGNLKGLYGKDLADFYSGLAKDAGNILDEDDKLAIKQLFSSLESAQTQLKDLAAEYSSSNGLIPDELDTAIKNSSFIGALTGNLDQVKSAIGNSFAESEGLKTQTQTYWDNMSDSMNWSLKENYPEFEKYGTDAGNHIKDSLRELLSKPLSVTLPINITPEVTTNNKLSGILDTMQSKSKLPSWKLGDVKSNAKGSIVTHPILTTFAEEGPEAAIPLDGSENAIKLWYTAGQILGMFDLSNEYKNRGISIPESYQQLVNSTSSNSSVTNAPTFNIEYNIKVDKGADAEKVKQAVTMSQEHFNYMMEQYEKGKGRVSMGGKR